MMPLTFPRQWVNAQKLFCIKAKRNQRIAKQSYAENFSILSGSQIFGASPWKYTAIV